MGKLHLEKHVNTCITDLAKLYTKEKNLIKPSVVSVANNTDLKVFTDADLQILKKRCQYINSVLPVLKLIVTVMKVMITAHLYMLSKFRITAMLLSFMLDFLHFSFYWHALHF